MTANLVVHFERTTYLVTPGPDTRRLAGRRRQIVVHKWADGRIELHHEGQPLPFKVAENYPFINPGDIVEKKRIDEVMSLIQQAQRSGERLAANRSVASRAGPGVPSGSRRA